MIRLNVTKCKVIIINPTSNRATSVAIPRIMLLGQALEIFQSYKYLGFELSSSLDSSLQWARVRAAVSPVEYLLKQLKLNGWSQSMLLTAYRAYFLSHFNYSAVMLTSASAASMKEMESLNRRLWKIMGIDENAARKYKLLSISEFIENICERTLNRILADSCHPITQNLPRNQRPDSKFEFHTKKSQKSGLWQQFLAEIS